MIILKIKKIDLKQNKNLEFMHDYNLKKKIMPKLINKSQKKTFPNKKFYIPAEYYNILIGVCKVEAQPYINRKSVEKIIL